MGSVLVGLVDLVAMAVVEMGKAVVVMAMVVTVNNVCAVYADGEDLCKQSKQDVSTLYGVCRLRDGLIGSDLR